VIFTRRAVAPADVLARAGLARGERVLAHAAADDGTWLLGTGDALVVVEPADTIRLAWETVESADWDRDTGRLRVAEVGDFGQLRPVHRFTLDDPQRLLQLVRERVTASVLLQRRVEVRGRRGLTVIARRPPRGRGEVTWAYELDAGLDPADPEVVRAAEEGLRAARLDVGLDGEPI
jgi:hypothetical protein